MFLLIRSIPFYLFMMHTKRFFYYLLSFFLVLSFSFCTTNKKERVWFVSIETNLGTMKIKLYNETPLHRDNFLSLIKNKFYDGLIFHRVIDEFMIQAGDPTAAGPDRIMKDSIDIHYTVPAEFHPDLFHKKGALAAARMGDNVNPEQASSSTQFYIVHGKTFNDQELKQLEERINNMRKQALFFKNIKEEEQKAFEKDEPLDYAEIQMAATLKTEEQLKSYIPYVIPPDHLEVYKTVGGTPHLDGSYTVFGEVVEGLDVVDRIAAVPTDNSDRPNTPVRIKIRRVRR